MTGSYITLTNLSEREIARIIALKISPLHISVHASDPELRARLLGNRRGAEGMKLIRRFADAGIIMHCQIVACPGINDGEALKKTMEDLASLYPSVSSVSVVPVGLTKHREGLFPLKPYTKEKALETVRLVEEFGKSCRQRHGSTIFFCSDEFYLITNLPLPDDAYYEGYPQLENGVGMLSLFKREFLEALPELPEASKSFSLATGKAAAPFLRELIDLAKEKCHNLCYGVYPVENHFFGETVDVAGLVTGGDLIRQLRGKPLGERLLIPATMLRHGGDRFLDDVTPEEVSAALEVPLVPVMQDGYELARVMLGGE
jgi:putative radical SAM enzyme (TIGR03279 family)